METIDDDVAARSAEFIEKQHKAGKPFFVWVNFTHMNSWPACGRRLPPVAADLLS